MNWENYLDDRLAGRKRKFSDKRPTLISMNLYETAKNNGVIGENYWEPAAAGYFLLLCEHDKWHKVAEAINTQTGRK